MINDNASSELISFIMLLKSIRNFKFYPKLCLASDFTLKKSTGNVTQQDMQRTNVTSGSPYPMTEKTISVSKY